MATDINAVLDDIVARHDGMAAPKLAFKRLTR